MYLLYPVPPTNAGGRSGIWPASGLLERDDGGVKPVRIIGRLAMWSFGIDVKILIKKELFFFPMGIFLKAVGGVPVDRKGGKTNITGQIAKKFAEQDKLCVLFTPEGTRSYNPNWKKGFYYLAIKADVPIFLGYIDYKHKTGGIKKKFVPTGDVNKDLEEIKAFYKDYSGKFPDQGVR